MTVFLMCLLLCLTLTVRAQPPDAVEVARFGSGYATNVHWHPDGTQLFVVTEAAELWVYDSELKTAAFAVENIRYAAVPPHTRYLVTWDAAQQQSVRHVDDPHQTLLAGALNYVFSPNGLLLAAIGEQAIDILDAQTLQPVFTAPREDAGLYWRSDSQRFVVAEPDHMTVWDAVSGQPMWTAATSAMAYQILAWSPDGTQLARSDLTTGRVEMWNAENGDLLYSTDALFMADENRGGATVRWSADGSRYFSCELTFDAFWMPCTRYDAATGLPIGDAEHGNYAFEFSPDGTAISWGGYGLLDAATGELLASYADAEGYGGAYAAWSPDSRRVVFSQYSAPQLVVYDAIERRTVTTLDGHIPNNGVDTLRWSPDGTRLVSKDATGRLVLWDMGETPRRLRVFDDHVRRRLPRAMADQMVDLSGRLLAIMDETGGVVLWDFEAQALRSAIPATQVTRRRLAWQPHGSLVALVNEPDQLGCAACPEVQNSLRVWDSAAAQYPTPDGLPSSALFWSPSGRQLGLTGAKNIAVLNVETGAAVIRSTDFSSYPPGTMRWSPDETQLLLYGMTGSHGGMTLLIRDAATLAAKSPMLDYYVGSTLTFTWDTDDAVVMAAQMFCRDAPTEPTRCPIEIRYVPITNPQTPFAPPRYQVSDVEPAFTLGSTRQGTRLNWSPDGIRLLSIDGLQLQLWNITRAGAELQFTRHIPFTGIFRTEGNWHAASDLLAFTTTTGVRVLDAKSGSEVLHIAGAVSATWRGNTLVVCLPDGDTGCRVYQEWSLDGRMLAEGTAIPAYRTPDNRYTVYERGGAVFIYAAQGGS